jgi:hypothetical protein
MISINSIKVSFVIIVCWFNAIFTPKKLRIMQKLEKINELDKKIPIINFDLYYPKD